MALPTTGPLSLNDIRIEIGASSTNVSLGAMSDTAGFSAPDAITDFYGYSASSCTSFLTNTTNTRNPCTLNSSNATYYHNGASTYPANGDTIYTNSSCTTTAGAKNRRWFFSSNSGGGTYLTNSSGVVTSVGICF